VRLKEYVSAWLNLPWEECEPVWKEALKHYGTTLEWLITEKGLKDVDGYFAFVHPENEADSLPPDPELREFLLALPCQCSVLTNSPLFHAERIIKKLELEGIFKYVFAIETHGLKGKPHPDAFNRALDALTLKAFEVLFIDDIPRYAAGFIDIGGKGILLDEKDIHRNYPYEKIKNLKELTRFL
jgi:putative hydrolase of the HAD superfamily